MPRENGARPRSGLIVLGALLVILLIGSYMRFTGLNWDDYTHLHPDERFLTQVVSAMGGPLSMTDCQGDTCETALYYCTSRYPETGGRGGFFDAQCSPFNPNNVGHGLYVYGTLPPFLAKLAGDAAVRITGDATFAGYDGIHLVWRALSATADMLTILTLFFIGRRMRDQWVGLLAAALYMAAPLALQKSHFATVNAMATLFTTLALLFTVRIQRGGKLRDYIGFGLAFAAALASRINLLPLAGILALVAGLRILPLFDKQLAWRERERALTENVLGLVLAGIVTLIAFRLMNPYAFTGPGVFGMIPNPRWLEDVNTAQYLVSGESESPPNWQWVGRPSYLFPLWNMILWGMGVALGVMGWFGWGWGLFRVLRGRKGALSYIVPVAWVGGYFLV
ncbi:MAG: glycosyltransferase family 39 protein, partial [Burkholderiales bacterium]|nr:glycosyltransferase family 39 protein [Anaerolineae bacterium]